MSIATPADAAPPRLDVGWVIGSTFAVILQRLPALAVLSLIFVIIPQVLGGFLPESLSRIGFAVSIPGLVFQGGASLITYHQLSGGPPMRFSEALRAGLRRLDSLLGLSVLMSLGEGLGLLALIVPGVALIAGWTPAPVIMMVENIKLQASLDRAWTMTKGSRLRLSGLVGILAVATLIVGVLMLAVWSLLESLSSETIANTVLTFVEVPVLASLLLLFTSVGSGVVYVALRRAQEGPGTEIAAVFD